MANKVDVDLGKLFFTLSKLEDEQLPTIWDIKDVNAVVFLEYFMNLMDISEIMFLHTIVFNT
jgi:hypothetical protein